MPFVGREESRFLKNSMSNVERGVGFHFNTSIDHDAVKIIPVAGAPVDVRQLGLREQFYSYDILPSDEERAHGSITLQKGLQSRTVPDGEVHVALGKKVEVSAYGVYSPIQIIVPKDGSTPQVFDPRVDPLRAHALHGDSAFTGQAFPVDNPQFIAFEMQKKVSEPVVTMTQANSILGYTCMRKLIEHNLIRPQYVKRGLASEFDAKTIIRAFLLRSLKEDTKTKFWSDIKPSMAAPYTESLLRYIESRSGWVDTMKRAEKEGLNLQKTIGELYRAAKGYRS